MTETLLIDGFRPDAGERVRSRLREILKSPESWDAEAEAELCQRLEESFAAGEPLVFELGGQYTASGQDEIFRFTPADFCWVYGFNG